MMITGTERYDAFIEVLDALEAEQHAGDVA
jgi:hypothetical protein